LHAVIDDLLDLSGFVPFDGHEAVSGLSGSQSALSNVFELEEALPGERLEVIHDVEDIDSLGIEPVGSHTLVGLACAVVNALALQWIARRRVDINMRSMQELDKMHGVSIAGIQQIETLKASALESDFFTKWASVHANMINARQTLGMTNQTLSIFPTFLTALATAFVLIIGSIRVVEGSLSIGMLIAFQSLMQSFLAPVIRLIDFGATLQELQT
jgi:ABC-type multidrug transport system fused ATPase/permease subunit